MKASQREDNRQDRGSSLRIDRNKVSVLFDFWNEEPELTAHVAFGLHPGFGAASFESFRLQMPSGCYRRYFSHRQLSLWRNAGLRFFRWGNAIPQK
jgi:hypothetical protein